MIRESNQNPKRAGSGLSDIGIPDIKVTNGSK